MRSPLSKGTIILLNGKEYHIDSVIGEGASCIVYGVSVRTAGITYYYRLKECYPYNAQCRRDGVRIIWEDEVQRQAAFERFRKAARVIANLRSEESIGNNITETELAEGNGTLYALMSVNHAKTYDYDASKDLRRILQTMLKLTRIVGRLHEQGYLHLDIKPENFLVNYDPDPNIWLFDVDSLIPMADLQSGKTACYSYSKEWAAPELSQGKLKKVRAATDLFSIGAILFNKVMGRPVANDDMGLFAEWDFSGEMFAAVNPKVQQHLHKVFQYTLSASVKRRYQTAEELASDLDQALNVIATPYLVSNVPDNTMNFVGREAELTAIQDVFKSGIHIAFLTGIGGIGKSELAKRYGNLKEGHYDAVLFGTYEDSINSVLLDFEIQNFEGDNEQKIKQLNRLLDEHVLLIIDNVNTENIPDFKLLEKLKCDILLTSRLDWKAYSFPIIAVNALSEENQVGLFVNEYGDDLDATQQKTVRRILADIEGYTLLIPLIAKQIRKGYCGFDEMAANIQNAGIKAAAAGKVRHLKDGRTMSGSIYHILSEVLSMASFSDREKYIMGSLALLGNYRFDQAEFLRWVGREYADQVDDLVFYGWVLREKRFGETTLSLHAVISDLYLEEFKPSIMDCDGIRNRLWAFAEAFAQIYKNPKETYWGSYVETTIPRNIQYHYDSYIRVMQRILERTDWKQDDVTICFWIQVISRVTNVIYGDSNGFIPLLKELIGAALKAKITNFPYLAEVALSLETIALKQYNLPDALMWAKFVILSLESVCNVSEIAFRTCFTFYQYISRAIVEGEDFANLPGFDEMSTWVEQIWADIVGGDSIELEEHDIRVLSDGECTITVDEAIERAYKDYCMKISTDGIAYVKNIYDYSAEGEIDISAIHKNRVAKYLPINADTSEVASELLPEENGFELNKEEKMLFARATALEKHINTAIDSSVISIGGMWLVTRRHPYTDTEKEAMYREIVNCDPKLPYHPPEVERRTNFVFALAQMEAAFSYAYAILSKWEEYSFHVSNLIKYYKILIYGRKHNTFFRYSGQTDLEQLPGAKSLLNGFYSVLPAERAHKLISEIIDIMEKYHNEQNISFAYIFELYVLALEFAQEANDSAAVSYWKNRISDVSRVRFREKTD